MVGTNVSIQRTGGRLALVTTRGFRDRSRSAARSARTCTTCTPTSRHRPLDEAEVVEVITSVRDPGAGTHRGGLDLRRVVRSLGRSRLFTASASASATSAGASWAADQAGPGGF